MRVIQTNLQVKDTPLMNPDKIAEEVLQLCGNTLVMNVGGIYAWYKSKIPYHHINEYLPKDRDILAEIIESCHLRGINVVGRFDFSKTDDVVYQQKPWWFVRNQQGEPTIYGKERPGEWSLLYSTCLNSGYRGDEFAVPVIHEVLSHYNLDGIFLNAPHYEFCGCQTCQDKYQNKYGEKIPEKPELLKSDWATESIRECTEKIYRAIKEEREELPLILYYNPIGKEDLREQLDYCDLICTESQDILSAGQNNLPPIWKPAMTMKVGRSLEENLPFGIIHSCPGMDWRHTGLPEAEYQFWMSQIPANGGYIWHSITGFSDTVPDKSILKNIKEINTMASLSEEIMQEAKILSDSVLLWDGKESGTGWFEGLTATQRQFDVVKVHQVTEAKLQSAPSIIVSEGFQTQEIGEKLISYVKQGGRLIIEGTNKDCLQPLMSILGTEAILETSENLTAAYLRMEKAKQNLFKGLSEKELLPYRGKTAYIKPCQNAEVFATLVPPFAPLDAVGAPPERASILSPKTDIPLIVTSKCGKGEVLFLPFQLSWLVQKYGLPEHLTLMKNCVNWGVSQNPIIEVEAPYGLQVSAFQKESEILLHFVNGVGKRPLTAIIPFHQLAFSVRLPENAKDISVSSCLAGQKIAVENKDGRLFCVLEKLDVWDMIRIYFHTKN